MRTVIIGLPQVGKTSLFTILTGQTRQTRLGPTAVQVGVAKVPDARVERLAELFRPPKVTHATVEYADMPALAKESLADPSYVGALRQGDAFLHVLRLFEDETVMHAGGDLDAMRDWSNIETELIVNDLVVVEKRLERVEKDIVRIKKPELGKERELLLSCQQALEAERPLRELELSPEEDKLLRGFQFLSAKPMLLVLNLGESEAGRLAEIESDYRDRWLAGKSKIGVAAVCGSVEAELAELSPDDAREYMASYGFEQPGLVRLIQASYSLLGLMSFLTAGETEVRAWTIPANSPAVQAAGAIHSDFERKFIRAEVIQWDKLVERGGYAGAREHGELRIEGKKYIVQEGDVLVIRHS